MWQRIFIASVALLVIGCQSAPATPTSVPAAPPTATIVTTPSPLPPTSVPTIQPAAPTSAPTPAATRTGELLYLDLSTGPGPGRLVVIDAATGEQISALPRGVPSRDWSTLYTAECRASATTVSALALPSGQPQQTRTIDGCYSLPPAGVVGLAGLSPSGRWLALAEASSSGQANTPAAEYTGQSRFVVLDSKLAFPPHVIDLKGSFSIDAVDNNGTSLYLIENLPASPPASIGSPYQVRRYDLATGTLEPGAIADKTASEPIMSGLRQTSVASADGQWLYSLYLNSDTGPFIHALNLDNHFALCLDLPVTRRWDVERQMLWSLAMSPDQRKLYAANGALGLVVQLDPANAAIQRVSDLALAAPATPAPRASLLPPLVASAEAKRLLLGGAVVTSDGQSLLMIDYLGLLSVGTDDLRLRGKLLANLPLTSIAASSATSLVYVVPDERPSRLIHLDPASGVSLSTRNISNLWGILGVGRG